MDEFQEVSAIIIDEVEEAIRKKHPIIDKYAEGITLDDGTQPNTLLYGEAYYNLEDAIAEILRRFIKKHNMRSRVEIEKVDLKANGLKELPKEVEFFKIDGENVKPVERYFKWDDSFEEELVFMARAGVTGELELLDESRDWIVKYVLKNRIVEVYEGTIVYPEKPSSILW